MLDREVQSEGAEAVSRRKFRQKLATHGYQGDELDRKVEELMQAPVRFRLDGPPFLSPPTRSPVSAAPRPAPPAAPA